MSENNVSEKPAESLPNEVTDLWGQLHQIAKEKYEELAPTPKRRELLVKGLGLIGDGVQEMIAGSQVSSEDDLEIPDTPPEVTALWRQLHDEAEQRLQDLDPAYIKGERQLVGFEKVITGIGSVLESVKP